MAEDRIQDNAASAHELSNTIMSIREAFDTIGALDFLYESGITSFKDLSGLPGQITQITQIVPTLLPFSITIYIQALNDAWADIPPNIVRMAIINFQTAITNGLHDTLHEHGDIPEQLQAFDDTTQRIQARLRLQDIPATASLELVQRSIDAITAIHPEWSTFLQEELYERRRLIAQQRQRIVYSIMMAVTGIILIGVIFLGISHLHTRQGNSQNGIQPTPGQYALSYREALWCTQRHTDLRAAAQEVQDQYTHSTGQNIPDAVVNAYKNSVQDWTSRCDRAYIPQDIKQQIQGLRITPSSDNVHVLITSWIANAAPQGGSAP